MNTSFNNSRLLIGPVCDPGTMNSVSQYYFISIIMLLLALFIMMAFITELVAHHHLDRVASLHSTISSYCSDPRGTGNRILLAVTFVVSSSLLLLLVQERMAETDVPGIPASAESLSDGWFFAVAILHLALPLVGLFYTTGQGIVQNKRYELGGWWLRIGISDLIHSIIALAWMITLTIQHVVYAHVAWRSRYYWNASWLRVYLSLAYVMVIVLCAFLVVQIIIYLSAPLPPIAYSCPECKSDTPLIMAPPDGYELDPYSCRRCFEHLPTSKKLHHLPPASDAPPAWTADGKGNFQTHIAKIHILAIPKRQSWSPTSQFNRIKWSNATALRRLYKLSFLLEGLVAFGAIGLAAAGSIVRIHINCEMTYRLT